MVCNEPIFGFALSPTIGFKLSPNECFTSKQVCYGIEVNRIGNNGGTLMNFPYILLSHFCS